CVPTCPRGIPNMAGTSGPNTAENCLKIRLHPCPGHDTSWTWPAHCDPKTDKKCLKIRPRLGHGLHTVPKISPKMPENQAVSLPGQDASQTRSIHHAQKLLEIT
ncbi:Hypothetical predicted protein, partial [Olea europaea subsp. europaea]